MRDFPTIFLLGALQPKKVWETLAYTLTHTGKSHWHKSNRPKKQVNIFSHFLPTPGIEPRTFQF